MSLPLLKDSDLAANLRTPGAVDHKYTRGVVGVCAGSQSYPGAAVLVAGAAARSGAGMVRLLAPARVQDLVLQAYPEVVPAPGKYQSLVCGPGIDPADGERSQQVRRTLQQAWEEQLPTVIDAGALALFGEELLRGKQGDPQQVLTPHAGEAAALLHQLWPPQNADDLPTRAELTAEPAKYARTLSELTGTTVVLKGHQSYIAAPSGGVFSVPSGPAWLATAGSGDVLAGILGALLANARSAQEQHGEEWEPTSVAAAAVRLHGLAGYRAAGLLEEGGEAIGHPIVASDLLTEIPKAWQVLGTFAAARAKM